MNTSQNKICYICGNAGAMTSEHVIPKCLLRSGNYNETNRFILPAHNTCNNRYSKDEEYVRDLVIRESEYLGELESDEILKKVQRAWTRPEGKRQLDKHLKNANLIEVVSRNSGIYLGKAIGIRAETNRIKNVFNKVVKGFLYKDASLLVPDDTIIGTIISSNEAHELQKKDSHEMLWQALCSEGCIHDMWENRIAVRRIYVKLDGEEKDKAICFFAVVLMTLVYVGGVPLQKSI